MKTALVFALSISALLGSNPADACSCAPWSQSDAFEYASSVYRATVLQQDPVPESGSHFRTYRLVVSRFWKGDVGALETVSTTDNSASCGLPMVTGEDYLVYPDRLIVHKGSI
jgi:hypothetical protein